MIVQIAQNLTSAGSPFTRPGPIKGNYYNVNSGVQLLYFRSITGNVGAGQVNVVFERTADPNGPWESFFTDSNAANICDSIDLTSILGGSPTPGHRMKLPYLRATISIQAGGGTLNAWLWTIDPLGQIV